jgi:hypothetical protein
MVGVGVAVGGCGVSVGSGGSEVGAVAQALIIRAINRTKMPANAAFTRTQPPGHVQDRPIQGAQGHR